MSLAFRVGLLVFLALLFLSIGIFLIGDKDLLFTSTYRLKAEFQNVGGLNNGAQVLIGGTNQGTVKEIDLPSRPDGKVTVVMNLRSSTLNLLKKDSRASIETEGLLGDKYIEVSFGSTKGQPVQNGDTIAGEAPEDIGQEAHALADQANQGITAIRDDAEALQHNFFLRGFFERRGYNEPDELTQHLASHLPKTQPAQEFDFDAGDLFEKSDEAKLKGKGKLDEAGKYLEDNGFGLVVIAAWESKGDTEKLRILTEARAKVVRDYLVQNFKIKHDKRLETIGLGKSKETDQPSGVSILIYSVGPPADTVDHSSTRPSTGTTH